MWPYKQAVTMNNLRWRLMLPFPVFSFSSYINIAGKIVFNCKRKEWDCDKQLTTIPSQQNAIFALALSPLQFQNVHCLFYFILLGSQEILTSRYLNVGLWPSELLVIIAEENISVWPLLNQFLTPGDCLD